ncbi:MAG: hypothetical protein Q8L79_15600 [Methylobacter sp.]|uniref:hypothetical protein n=1 Tax=Methylobacter sp. TaxID=2051955 RepID=UPI00272F26CD|nr:hypothetical protein [Methylobacter sp.]MDP1666534.1 hypothetical protein [Methylobacter sp.]MDP1970960.1 hypothetical protein [Methylobacter sp.]
MKLVSIIIVGLILLYFIDSAFKLNPFNVEMLIHSGLRFLAGFLILGIGVFYAHQIRLKFAICLILALALADDIRDYTRDVESFTIEVMLHSIYMLLWGSLTGYMLMRRWLDGRRPE